MLKRGITGRLAKIRVYLKLPSPVEVDRSYISASGEHDGGTNMP
jgi:hypothetical protein